MALGTELGIDWERARFVPVEHHLAHASSAYHLSDFKGKCAILGVDGKGEYATTFFGYGEAGQIHRIKEFYDPDSLGGVYGAITEFLGFEMLDGEYKVMGMAPYGDPTKFDLSPLIAAHGDEFRVNTKLVNTVGLRRYKETAKVFSSVTSSSGGWVRVVSATSRMNLTSTMRPPCRNFSKRGSCV